MPSVEEIVQTIENTTKKRRAYSLVIDYLPQIS